MTVYGLIQKIDEARAYNLTIDPYFYSPDAAVRYRQSTYEDKEQDQGHNEDENNENIRGIWESDDEDITEPTETAEHRETDGKEKPPQQENKKTDNTERPRSKP